VLRTHTVKRVLSSALRIRGLRHGRHMDPA
jgi:hypothetical protein